MGGGRAMLRLATKLVAFFWRRADGPDEDAGPPGSELAEGASRGGAALQPVSARRAPGRAGREGGRRALPAGGRPRERAPPWMGSLPGLT